MKQLQLWFLLNETTFNLKQIKGKCQMKRDSGHI